VAVITKITEYRAGGGWSPPGKAREACGRLERGEILFFATTPFELPQQDREFLLAQKQADSRFHKNISYRPKNDEIRGVERRGADDAGHGQLQDIMRRYSAEVTRFTRRLLEPYAEKLTLDFASFRPLEEEGRNLPLKKRNDLLHVDAFPSRPTRGGRILRVFTNVNPSKNRIWLTGERFSGLAKRYADDAGLRTIAGSKLRRRTMHLLHGAGIPVPDRSAYDEFMLRFHDFLKENSEFQSGDKERVEFPPMSTWLVFTDGVPHAALSGQFAMEQTFIVPPEALVSRADAPIAVLEAICGEKLG